MAHKKAIVLSFQNSRLIFDEALSFVSWYRNMSEKAVQSVMERPGVPGSK